VKFGAGAHARGDQAGLRKILDTSTAMFLIIAGLAAVVTLILGAGWRRTATRAGRR